MSTPTSEPDRDAPRSPYETSDARLRPLLLFTVGLIALVAFAMIGTSALFGALDRTRRGERHPMAAERETPPEPNLQIYPVKELAEHRAWEEEMLRTHGWIDPSRGIVRLPIERAMELVAERGLPHRDR